MPTLKELRQKQGLTQQELAERLNISRVSVTEWENGKSEPRSMATVKLLAKELNCTFEDIAKAILK